MGFFDFLFRSLGWPGGGYGHIIAWIKKRYSDRFCDGMHVYEVKNALMNIKPEKENSGFRKALKKYIEAENYDNLVRVKKE